MSDRCKILFVIPTLRGGGAERVLTVLLQYWDVARFEVTVCIIDPAGAEYLDKVPAGINIVMLGSSRVRYGLIKIVRLIWALRPQVVFSFIGYLNIALAISKMFFPSGVKLLARESIVVREHLQDNPCRRSWEAAYRVFYRRLDGLICQSSDMQRDMVDNFGIPERRVILIHNPVDLDHIKLQTEVPSPLPPKGRPEKIYLVAAGRFEHQKGFDLLIEAIALIKDPRLHLFLLGGGPLREQLMRQAENFKVSEQITFAGFQKNPYTWFAHADALVLSSRYEGFPNVLIEALACGTPVVAVPAQGGVREILENVPACKVADQISAASLAEALVAWVAMPSARVPSAIAQRYEARKITKLYESEVLRVAGEGS